jgi:exopolyphosphatase/guanosine-5'-triphosphate,3'-diphosphate pyrophosphatase
MSISQRYGMIDIGSNSIRLVIYEYVDHTGYRIIDESKQSARLSERITNDGGISEADILVLATILNRFQLLCAAHQVCQLRAVATAAIRNAANTDQIIQSIHDQTGLLIDVLSGEEEARMGFLGVMNTMPEKDGFLIDIGGGSTEVTLFRNRQIVNSISFPFGAVNTTKQFSDQGVMNDDQLNRLHEMIDLAVAAEPWIASSHGLPCIGLGGTFRTISKLHQKLQHYSLSITHHYELAGEDVAALVRQLMPLDSERRKKIYGVSKDRADLIVPGMVIASRLFNHMRASHLLISGSGLRDGLFFSTILGRNEPIDDIVEHSVRNLLAMHPEVSTAHVEHVNKLALTMYDDLYDLHGHSPRVRQYLHAASLLYRIGVGVQFHEYYKHTYYLIAHSRLGGLAHREMLICALVAAFKSKTRIREMFQQHKDILTEVDLQLIVQLGTILRMAVALDRSETQPVHHVHLQRINKDVTMQIHTVREPVIERLEWTSLEKDFAKVWGVKLHIHTLSTHF